MAVLCATMSLPTKLCVPSTSMSYTSSSATASSETMRSQCAAPPCGAATATSIPSLSSLTLRQDPSPWWTDDVPPPVLSTALIDNSSSGEYSAHTLVAYTSNEYVAGEVEILVVSASCVPTLASTASTPRISLMFEKSLWNRRLKSRAVRLAMPKSHMRPFVARRYSSTQ